LFPFKISLPVANGKIFIFIQLIGIIAFGKKRKIPVAANSAGKKNSTIKKKDYKFHSLIILIQAK